VTEVDTVTEVARFVVPFSVLSESRAEPFSEEAEEAAIYCLANLERSKGGGLVLKKAEEQLVFLAEFGYPFWLLPWNELTLAFDGMKKTSHSFAYNDVADVRAFSDNLQRSSKSMETYAAFLSESTSYFCAPTSEKTKTTSASFSEAGFLAELSSALPTVKQADPQASGFAFLSPMVDLSEVQPLVQELESLRLGFARDVDTLYESMKLVSKLTRNFVKIIRSEMKKAKDEYAEQIRKQESLVKPKVDHINEEYDEQITHAAKSFQKQLAPLQSEKVRLKKSKEQMLGRIERYKLEAKTREAVKDSAGEKKWKEKANESKKELSRIEDEIRRLERKLKEAEENKSLETIRLKSEWETKVKEAKKELTELEDARDAKTQTYQQEIEKLENLTSTVVQKIGETAKLREADLASLGKLGIAQERQSTALLYVPFYLACYQAEAKKRYVVFAPSTVNSVGLSAKIKGVLGGAKIKNLFTERFSTISLLLHRLPSEIEGNAVFEREATEAGEKASLTKVEFREAIGRGLSKLIEESWLSEKEHADFSQMPA
jgi:hypothetical protein